jgi:hypothetical protein
MRYELSLYFTTFVSVIDKDIDEKMRKRVTATGRGGEKHGCCGRRCGQEASRGGGAVGGEDGRQGKPWGEESPYAFLSCS